MATQSAVGKELTIVREFDAPRELVWKAWTEPEYVKRWWGPTGYSSPVNEIDFRVGGKYLSAMRGPEGTDIWSTGTYLEIVPLKRLVMTDSFADECGNVVPASHYGMKGSFPLEVRISLSFEERGGKTRMTLQHAGIPEGEIKQQTTEGWNQSFDKLDAVLQVMKKVSLSKTKMTIKSGKQEIVSRREFDAPRELVYKAYTDAKLIPQWWGPKRYTTTVEKMELKPGGVWRFVQRDESGEQYGFHGVYHQVSPNERIVSTFEYEGMPNHALLDIVTFQEDHGKTILTEKTVFETVEDRDGMLKTGMEEGAHETMDRLAELLTTLQ